MRPSAAWRWTPACVSSLDGAVAARAGGGGARAFRRRLPFLYRFAPSGPASAVGDPRVPVSTVRRRVKAVRVTFCDVLRARLAHARSRGICISCEMKATWQNRYMRENENNMLLSTTANSDTKQPRTWRYSPLR